MKLYKITRLARTFPNDDLGLELAPGRVEYAGTQADARKVRIAFEAPFKELKPKERPDVAVEEVDVPTDKAGLLAYLNHLVG